jgi:hypothetical protein
MRVVHFDRLKPYMGPSRESWVEGPLVEPQLEAIDHADDTGSTNNETTCTDPDETLLYDVDIMNNVPAPNSVYEAANQSNNTVFGEDPLTDSDETIVYDLDAMSDMIKLRTSSDSEMNNSIFSENDMMNDPDKTIVYDHDLCKNGPGPSTEAGTEGLLMNNVQAPRRSSRATRKPMKLHDYIIE